MLHNVLVDSGTAVLQVHPVMPFAKKFASNSSTRQSFA